ncbi:uncharacterized protein LOC134269868 [Saccostrea cucullata]|uniref:uncharacterized protein LOC134269868 n=1 Tax=Saccostrea cuccullata TaxID=36930 RepID=UPI002ED2A3CE
MLNSDDQERRKQALDFIKSTSGCQGESSNDKRTQEEKDVTDVKNWSKEDIKCLFDIRRQKEKQFNGSKVHKSLWDTISHELSDLGIAATATQCSNKWKAMKREYKKTVDNNSRTGAEKKTCPFHDDFGELYGNKSGTRPQYVMASKKVNTEDDKEDSTCNSGSSPESSSKTSTSSSSSSAAKKITKRKRKDQFSLLEEYTKGQEKYRKERFGINLKEFYDFQKYDQDYCKDLQLYLMPTPTKCFNSPVSYVTPIVNSDCENMDEDVSSQQLSTKCFTPQTLLIETGLNIEHVSDTDSSDVRIATLK